MQAVQAPRSEPGPAASRSGNTRLPLIEESEEALSLGNLARAVA